MKQERAFTLIELLVTLVIAAVVLAVGVPAFTNMVETNRVSAHSTELRTAMQLARNEAVKRRLPVSVCAANIALTQCDSNNWANGWIVFTDDDGVAGSVDGGGDTVLRVWAAPDGQHGVSGSAPDFVRYRAGGNVDTAAVFTIKYANCKGNQAKQMTISVAGLVSVINVACG